MPGLSVLAGNAASRYTSTDSSCRMIPAWGDPSSNPNLFELEESKRSPRTWSLCDEKSCCSNDLRTLEYNWQSVPHVKAALSMNAQILMSLYCDHLEE